MSKKNAVDVEPRQAKNKNEDLYSAMVNTPLKKIPPNAESH